MLFPLLLEDSSWAPKCRQYESTLDIFKPLAVVDGLLKLSEIAKEMKKMDACLKQETGSDFFSENKFHANFDVQHFKPEEITVKVSGGVISVEAKHEEKQDEHGQVYRHFVRKYKLPKNCDLDRLETKLSSDGVLSISAPVIGKKTDERSIPITQTGKPARALEESEKSEFENPKKKKKISK
ncbi:unnamed protein product [Psylliodes chrysocephalus]|uniref:SHSP domain-containing protein n=1 Tax=Psylliodes chrysocephalus TaxID=3402493 RepID=A0A9P0CRB6_9CUCU|nr:unnamed protein product [Psylliodes chrysocephala]